ncbi:protein FAM161B [Betta splendens]|uniref:Protein FAM161B n=1 Tax=Betta splendens TaxID=158456 RepID=A0A6P7LI89_BETSP|nr:protein FAM161B [Betta splendens]XP_028994412.1 protein FAM161B [Betta splendens]
MSKLQSLLEDGVRSELLLQQQLKALSETLQQQLQEAERRQMEELEKRIHQNALLSTGDRYSGGGDELNNHIKRSASEPALDSHKDTLLKSNLSSPARLLSTNRNHSEASSIVIPDKTRLPSVKTTQMIKEEEAEAECQKKFVASPAPRHVTQPLYQQMVERKEKERKLVVEQRTNLLLSMQKPFSFHERERQKREKLMAMTKVMDQENKDKKVIKPHKVENSEANEQEDGCRRVSTNPTASGIPKLRTAQRNRKQKLGFLDDKPSFRPKIIHQVPDFIRLHRALQTEMLGKNAIKDGTKCQPFSLRTSTLPERQRRTSPESSQVLNMSLSRSKSLGALTSLSSDTLPTYISDAARKRCTAIRNSMEVRESKNQESAEWFRKYQTRSRAMKKAVALHAKLLDPHRSLNEVFHDKTRHHREADKQKMREYSKELQEMKARVSERPYLFQLVKQKNAKAHAEQVFWDKLKKAGLKEQFVEENGEAGEEVSSSSSSRSEENRSNDSCSPENDMYNREENVDDGEKIEAVEEESVKSKGEEMA